MTWLVVLFYGIPDCAGFWGLVCVGAAACGGFGVFGWFWGASVYSGGF